MSKRLDLTGQRFGLLTVISFSGIAERSRTLWHCVCDCGNPINMVGKNLKSGNTRSCGCLKRSIISKRMKVHGKSATPEFRIWCGMRKRCNNKNAQNYQRYGAKGITICDSWHSFQNFLRDMGLRPSDKHTIERIDNTKGYSPDNCTWATIAEQNRNTSRNRYIEFAGRRQCLSDWATELGTRNRVIAYRIRRWGVERALTTPVKTG